MSKKKKGKKKRSVFRKLKTRRFWYVVLIYIIVFSFVITGVLTGIAGLGAF